MILGPLSSLENRGSLTEVNAKGFNGVSSGSLIPEYARAPKLTGVINISDTLTVLDEMPDGVHRVLPVVGGTVEVDSAVGVGVTVGLGVVVGSGVAVAYVR